MFFSLRKKRKPFKMKAVHHQAKARVVMISFVGARIQLESFEYTKGLIAPPEQQQESLCCERNLAKE